MHNTRELLCWYRANKRGLPWRRTSEPYAIWVSEIMLQQTRVDTATGYYERFMRAFPNVQALAAATEAQVLTIWKGLGYYTRPRNMLRAAGIVLQQYGGQFPRDYKSLAGLPGIGAYTAAAILSIAYGQPCPAVDGNALRVAARLFALEDDIGRGAAKKKVSALLSNMLEGVQAGEFTQAVMELGALVCTPVSPQCGACPLRDGCEARRKGLTDALPVRGKRQSALPEEHYLVAAVLHGDRLLMQYRGGESLLGRLWGLPMYPFSSGVTQMHVLPGVRQPGNYAGEARYVFTHKVWRMRVYLFDALEPDILPEKGCQWVRLSETDGLPIPVAFEKAIDLVKKALVTGA